MQYETVQTKVPSAQTAELAHIKTTRSLHATTDTNSERAREHRPGEVGQRIDKQDICNKLYAPPYIYMCVYTYTYIYIYHDSIFVVYMPIYETCAWIPSNVFWALMVVESLLCNFKWKSKHPFARSVLFCCSLRWRQRVGGQSLHSSRSAMAR